MPVDSVLVKAYLVEMPDTLLLGRVFSDSAGRFHVGPGLTGSKGCRMSYVILFAKPGYEPILVADSKSSDTVLLTPLEIPGQTNETSCEK